MISLEIQPVNDPFAHSELTESVSSTRCRPPPASCSEESSVRRVCRCSIASQLSTNGHVQLAGRISQETNYLFPASEAADGVGIALLPCIDRLIEDLRDELDEKCDRLGMSQQNAGTRFRAATHELFARECSWRHVMTMVAFACCAAVHCANLNMEEQAVEVMDETEKYIHDHLVTWIRDRAHKGSPFNGLSKCVVNGGLSLLGKAAYAFLGMSPGSCQ